MVWKYNIAQKNTYYTMLKRYVSDHTITHRLTTPDVLKDIKMSIETDFGIKDVEHKEWLYIWF